MNLYHCQSRDFTLGGYLGASQAGMKVVSDKKSGNPTEIMAQMANVRDNADFLSIGLAL